MATLRSFKVKPGEMFGGKGVAVFRPFDRTQRPSETRGLPPEEPLASEAERAVLRLSLAIQQSRKEHTTLFDNGDYSLHAKLSPVASPEGGHALTITSRRQESRNPNEDQVKFFACLDRQGLEGLFELINLALSRTDGTSTSRKGNI
jgi:hypothetical protein